MNFMDRLPKPEPTSLSTMPVGRGERRLTTGVIALSAIVFASLAPTIRLPLAVVPAFIPAYEAALVICDLITSLLLFGQFAQRRSYGLLALASGYLFDGLIVIPHALSFPGVFAPAGLLGAGPHTTAWLYMFWHGGFPIFVMAYVGLETRALRLSHRPIPGASAAICSAVAVAALVGVFTLLATAGQHLLPSIMDGSHYLPALTVVVTLVLALSGAALLILWRKRSKSVLDFWLMAVASAWLCDIALSAVLNGGRYDLGFYAGRVYGLLAASFVLAVLLLETSGLYCRLAKDKAKIEEEAEDALRASEARLRLITDSLPIAIFQISRDGRLLFANKVFSQWFGEKVGTDDEGVIDKVFKPSQAEQWDLARSRLRSGATVSAGGTVTDLEANRRDIRLTMVPRVGGDEDVLGLMEDVTNFNATLAQLHRSQKMEAVGQLTGGIAHDFNNLLGIIIGNLDLLEGAFDNDPDNADLAKSALGAALRGADLTRALLAFSRRQALNPVRTEVNDILTKLAQLLRRTLGEQILVTLEIDNGLWPVSIDVAQLESSITNLAINARDAMPDGGRLVITTSNAVLDGPYVELNPDATAGDYVLVEVSDTGTGMTPEVTRQVFEPFYTTKPEGKGTGLGLSMVYGFIKQSGGHIKIYSEVGHGTTIRLYLPRLVVEKEEAPAVAVKAASGGTETILVVEDNDDMRRMVVRQLGDLGYHTMEASNGAEALELIGNGVAFDLLFSDVVMPGGMSGFELGQAARKDNPDLRILFTSGFPGTIIPEVENGAKVELLSKPYRKDDLARRVRQMLDLGKETR